MTYSTTNTGRFYIRGIQPFQIKGHWKGIFSWRGPRCKV